MSFFTSRAARRKGLARQAPAGPLRAFYEAELPTTDTPVDQVAFVALDVETTGLAPKNNDIVSVGWVNIDSLALDLGSASHRLAHPERGLTGESVPLHGLTDDDLKGAPSLEATLADVLQALTGKIMVAHYAKVELTFLNAACRKVYGAPFEIPTVDTLDLEGRSLRRLNQVIPQGSLRLDAVRGRYNLPRYKAHNALLDALACGELFLAQVEHRRGARPLPLKEVLQ